MSDITNEPNGASMLGGLTGPVAARVEQAHYLEFEDSEIPQNILFHNVIQVNFDDEGSFIVETTTRKFNIVFNWVRDESGDEE